MTDNETTDELRSLRMQIKTWYYHKDYPDIHEQETTNWYGPLEENGPFTNTRDEWFDIASDTITERMIDAMITEFWDKGIDKPPGENTGSIDWDYEVVDIEKEVKPGVVPVIVPKEIIDAIKGYERSATALRESAEKLRAIPELREDFLRRASELQEKANDLRKKYGVIGKEL